MPKNHVEVHVKNVIKLDHSKKTNKKRKPTKKGRKNNIPTQLVKPNNTQYDKNAKTFYTPGSSLILPQENKYGYDKTPRITYGMNPNDTNSTNFTQKLLLEHQRKNEEYTNKLLQNQHKQFKDGFKEYHTHYIEPLHKYQNELHDRVTKLDLKTDLNDAKHHENASRNFHIMDAYNKNHMKTEKKLQDGLYSIQNQANDFIQNHYTPKMDQINNKLDHIVRDNVAPYPEEYTNNLLGNNTDDANLYDVYLDDSKIEDDNPFFNSNNTDNLTQPFEEIFVPIPESESKLEGELIEFKEAEPKTEPEVGRGGVEHKGESIDNTIKEKVIPTSQTDDDPNKTKKPINKRPIYFTQLHNKKRAIYVYKKLFNDTEYEKMELKPMQKKIIQEAKKQNLGTTILIPTRLL